MYIFDIKSKQQANGLWGTPLNVKSMKGVLYPDSNMKKLSAVLVVISDLHGPNCRILVEDLKTVGFIRFDITNSSIWDKHSPIFVSLDDYEVVKNKLYYVKNDEDKLIFSRMMKIKRIKECQNS